MNADGPRPPMTDDEIEARWNAPHPFREPPEDDAAWSEWAHEWLRHPAFKDHCASQPTPDELVDYWKRHRDDRR